ncbi:MAG: cation transporter [Mycobacterium sp.]|nr:cation transporter [Mycobacterium sp.]
MPVRGFAGLAFLVMRDWSQRRRLGCVLALNVVMIAGLIVTGLIAGSLGLLAAAVDFAADSVALVLGLVAVGLRDRRRVTAGRPSRATTVVALINGTALLAVTVLVLVEAVQRLSHGTPEVRGLPVLIVSAISALVMVIGAAILGFKAGSEDLHMRSVLLDTLSDAAAAAAVAVAGGVIAVTHNFYWLDPALAAAIALVVGVAAVKLLADGTREIRRGFPASPGTEDH